MILQPQIPFNGGLAIAHIPTRILVPIDFSAASDRALSMAKEGADRFGAEIHLIHVRAAVDDPAIDTAILDEVEQILTVSESKTRLALEQAGEHGGARVHAHIKRGAHPRHRLSLPCPNTAAIW